MHTVCRDYFCKEMANEIHNIAARTCVRITTTKKERRKGVVNLKMNKNLLFRGKKRQDNKHKIIS